MKVTLLTPTIMYIENAFEWGRAAIDIAESIPDGWGLSQTLLDDGMGSQLTPTVRSSEQIVLSHYADLIPYDKLHQGLIRTALEEYDKRCLVVPQKDLEVSRAYLLRYQPGQFYVEHADGHFVQGRYRLYSTVCYPNDEYDGGELVFKHQRITIKPTAGSVVVFPSSEYFVHAALPPTKGIKYSLPSWVSYLQPFALKDVVQHKRSNHVV